MGDFLFLLILSFIGSVAGLIGGVLFLVKKSWCKPLSMIATPLAAGTLLSLSLLDLFPEAVEEVGDSAFLIVLATILVSFFIERFLFTLHHHDHTRDDKAAAVSLVIFGDSIHNFLDGVAIGASFLISPKLGVFVALATFLHETPHEIADFGILIANGWSRGRAFIANLISALLTFPGAILTYFFAERVEAGVGSLLALAAGLFLYVAATDFLPEVGHSKGKRANVQGLFLILGVVIIATLGVLVPE